jgi:hypothetical protein
MIRHWSCAVVPLGLGGLALLAACGSDALVVPIVPDAGRSDSTAPIGSDDGSSSFVEDAGNGDATVDDGATGDDSTTDDAGDGGAGLTDSPSNPGADGGHDGSTEAGTADAGGDSGPSNVVDGGPDASTPDAGPKNDGGACNFAGTWGSKITIDVTWAAGGTLDIVIAPGSGTIKQYILSTRTQVGNTVTDTAVVCGIELPDFSSTALLNPVETYGIRFPNSLFDTHVLTSFTINGTVSGSTPTATYTTTPAAALLGLTLANATTAVWPATITTAIDEDNDGHPGITATVVPPGGGYSYVPLAFAVVTTPTTVPRADELYVAIRQVTSLSAQFSDCDHASGSVTVPQITDPSTGAKKYAIDSHVIGCRVTGTGTDCTTTGTIPAPEAPFVDNNQPVFVPAATTFTATRLPTGATCMDVRALP